MDLLIQTVKDFSMENKSPDSIAERIKFVRKECGLSQAQLADLIGSSRPTISRIERGEAIESLDSQILRICLALPVYTEWIYTGEGDIWKARWTQKGELMEGPPKTVTIELGDEKLLAFRENSWPVSVSNLVSPRSTKTPKAVAELIGPVAQQPADALDKPLMESAVARLLERLDQPGLKKLPPDLIAKGVIATYEAVQSQGRSEVTAADVEPLIRLLMSQA